MTSKTIKPISSNRRNITPKISYHSDDSTDDIAVIPTPANKKLLLDYSSENSSYEYDYSNDDNQPGQNDVTTKIIKKNNVNTIKPIRPPIMNSPKRIRPMPSTPPKRENKIQTRNPPQLQKESSKINTQNNYSSNEEDYDYYDYDSQYEYDKHEVDQPKQNIEVRRRIIKQRTQAPISNEEQYTKPEHNPNENIIKESVIKEENDSKDNQIDNKQIPPPIPETNTQLNKENSPNEIINLDQEQNNQIIPAPISPESPKENDDDDQTFQITYFQKKLQNLWKRQILMTKDDILVYICGSIKKENYGKVHVICTKKPVDPNSNFCVGMIVRHQTGRRFTLYEKLSDFGTSPQIAGISLITPKEDSSLRMFRVAIPIDGQPYLPATKMADLSRIAQENANVPSNVKVYESELPKKKANGSYTLNFGNYSIVRSTKNFCIKDENGENSFVIFKTFGSSCTLKFKPPFTPLIAYSISVAISTSMK